MRYAILSDIHANIWALEAVLQDVKDRRIDHIINLGDTLYGPLKPRLTFDLLNSIKMVSICGNQDRVILQAQNQIQQNPTLAYVLKDLGAYPLSWLSGFPKTDLFMDKIFACHGSPENDMHYLLEDISQGIPVVKKEEQIQVSLTGIQSSVVLCGHSHLPRVVRLSNGTIIINPGSVGLPAYEDASPNFHIMQTFSPFASYAILEETKSDWIVEQMKIPYDFSSASKCAKEKGRPDWARWLAGGRVD